MEEYKYLTAYEEHLVRTFPTLTAAELRQVNDSFPHYCFLHKRGDGVEVSTSCCHVDKRFYPWLRELDTPENRELLGRAHNEKGVCPYCGKPVTFKRTEKCGKFKNISSTGAVVFWKAERGAVWVQAYWARKEYWLSNLTGEVEYSFDNGYVFMRGQALQFWKGYSFWNAIREEQKIGRCIRITDPFEYGWLFHDRVHDWMDVGRDEAVANSFLKYSELDEFDHRWHCEHSTPFKFLTLYCVYPRAVEMLMKAGMMRVVSDFTDMRKKHAAAIKWDAENPVDAFGISKPELREFLATKREIGVLECYKYCKKHGLKTRIEDVETVYTELMGDSEPKDFYKKCVKYHLTPTKLWNYLCKFTGPRCHGMGYFGAEQVFQMWCDYLFAAEAIGYDMKNEMVIRPKNLELAHDEATGEHSRRLAEQRKKEMQAEKMRYLLERSRESYVERECDWLEYCGEMAKQAKYAQVVSERAQKYAFSDGVWFIRVARDADEVIAEGRALQHCVGGYAQRHMKGKTTICFMRKVVDPNTPELTIEVNGKELVQIHGFKNEWANGKRQPDPREVHKAFLDTWLDWVKRGSPRDKDGKPVIRKAKKKKEAAA